MYSLPFDVVLEGEETLLAGNGLKNLFRVSEYEPETLYTFLCGIQAAFHAFSSMLEVHSIDLSSNVGAWISFFLKIRSE